MDEATLRARLLSQEALSPQTQARRDREIAMLLEQKLSPGQRTIWAASGVFGLVFGAVVLGLAVVMPAGLRAAAPASTVTLMRVWFALFGAFGLGWAAVAQRVVRRGRFAKVGDANAMTGLMWVVMVGVMTVALLLAGQSPDPVKGLMFAFQAFVFLTLFGVVPLITNQVQQTSLRMREDLLRIELQVAELREAGQPVQPTP